MRDERAIAFPPPTPVATAPPPAQTPRVKRPARKPPALSSLPHKHGEEARRLAATLLEVLAGVRTPPEAATTLGVSLSRYYALEARALEGFLGACRPSPRGPRVTPERELLRLRRELLRRQRECARYQALLRLAQRAVGLAPRAEPRREPGRKRRPRRPSARALKAAKILRTSPEPLEKGGRKEDDASGKRA